MACTHPDSFDRLRRSHITAVLLWLLQIGVPLRVLWGYSDATVTEATMHTVAAEYPHSTLNGTPTWSSHSGIALWDPHSRSVGIWICNHRTVCTYQTLSDPTITAVSWGWGLIMMFMKKHCIDFTSPLCKALVYSCYMETYASRFLWLAMQVPYNAVQLWLLHGGIAVIKGTLRYTAATALHGSSYWSICSKLEPSQLLATCSGYSGNTLYETFVAGQRNLYVYASFNGVYHTPRKEEKTSSQSNKSQLIFKWSTFAKRQKFTNARKVVLFHFCEKDIKSPDLQHALF